MLQRSRPAGESFAGEFLLGMRTIFPLIVAVWPIGLVFGAVAATKGLSPLETALMSALVFAGGSQFVAMDIWTIPQAGSVSASRPCSSISAMC
ncbi:putative branched-subunit amino acid permease [Rhizobium sp. BK529]|nr:putative branched-subunit amino acid permease [Rhizobium sp. BK529]